MYLRDQRLSGADRGNNERDQENEKNGFPVWEGKMQCAPHASAAANASIFAILLCSRSFNTPSNVHLTRQYPYVCLNKRAALFFRRGTSLTRPALEVCEHLRLNARPMWMKRLLLFASAVTGIVNVCALGCHQTRGHRRQAAESGF